MRIAAIIALVASLYVCSASAQTGGHVGLYSDSPGYTDYCLTEQISQINRVYIVHTTSTQATGVRFMLTHPWAVFAPTVDFGTNLAIGDAFTGVYVAYVGCKPLPHLVGVVEWVPIVPHLCGAMRVEPDPASSSGTIEVTDCDGSTVLVATGGLVAVNAEFCGSHGAWWCGPIAVEESTWGRVKALYGN